ncbi:MAG: autotransporter outer membrane beta-barrel domain-containing protein [Thioclava marina]|uniref:choice-of-anchor F family protein n=1 Tax=Thioclava marina TaxID=1915077 RepID=UPI0019851667|nr:choice-of-anchor F family protein [Thioclava marina]MBC7145135.1 autotransporter outer membrane beta-barrel domain-containing protein [Thioclava marina]
MPTTLLANLKRTVAPATLVLCMGQAAWAGTFDDAPVISVTGDGYIFADPAEGVEPPGLKAVTGAVNVNFPNTSNPSGITNCLMANTPDFICTAPSGSGKRVKTRLTGPTPLEILLSTQASNGITEYYTYGKTSNLTGARILGFEVALGTGTGDSFTAFDPNDPLAAALFDADYNPKFNLPDGLFGDGGQEGAGVGFFDSSSAEMTITNSLITLDATNLSNSVLGTYFGNSLIDDSMLPQAFFWDATGTPVASDEDLLVAWYNVSTDQWQYGNLGVSGDQYLTDKLQALADTLGVSVADLGYTSGGDTVPADIVAAMQANGLFAEDVIEDLRNLNLNYMIDLGDVAGNSVTMRLTPIFAPIVAETLTPYQFTTAGRLDSAANIPYLDIGNAGTYQTAIADILAVEDPVAQNELLETTGFSFLPAFKAVGFEFGQSITNGIGKPVAQSQNGSVTISTMGGPTTWKIGDNTYAFVSTGAQQASYDRTVNAIGYDVNSYYLMLGAEKHVGSLFSVGLFGGYASGTSDANQDRGSIDGSGGFIGGFARAAFGTGGAAQFVLGYQDLSYDMKRNVMGETAKASTSGHQVFAALDAEYMFGKNRFRFGPTGSLEMYHLSVDGFDETGAGAWNLSVGDQSGNVVVASAGMRGEYALSSGPQAPTLSGTIKYNKVSGDDELVQVAFVGLPSSASPADGFDMNWMSADLGIDVPLGQTGKFVSSLHAGISGSFSSDYENHAVQFSFNAKF